MPRLSHADQQALLHGLSELCAQHDLAQLRDAIARLAHRLVPSDWVSFNEFRRSDFQLRLTTQLPVVPHVSRYLPALAAYFREHPMTRLRQTTGSGAPRRFSDLLSQRELQRSRLYNEYYLPVGTRYQMSCWLDTPGPTQPAIAFNRQDRDFSERDRAVTELLRQYCNTTYTTALAFARARQEITALEEAHEESGHGVVVVDVSGRVQRISASARRWLRTALGVDLGESSPLPDVIERWRRAQRDRRQSQHLLSTFGEPVLRLDSSEGCVTVRLIAQGIDGPDLLLVQLEASPTAKVALTGLTLRENEVLAWIAQGKSNPEIAIILGLSVRTVYKHVENLFAKLGVENRASAMLLALEGAR